GQPRPSRVRGRRSRQVQATDRWSDGCLPRHPPAARTDVSFSSLARPGGDIQLQDDLRDGTDLGVLLHGERPAKVLDDVVGNGKAKAEALAYALGGEERVEDAASDCVGNAGAVVAHRDGDLAPADALGGKGDGAVFGSLYRV